MFPEMYVLIGTILYFWFAAETSYLVALWFCRLLPSQRVRVEGLFTKAVDERKKFLGGAALAVIGIGKGTQIKDILPTTSWYLGCLTVVGFLAVFCAPLIARRSISVFYSFVAVSCHLAIMGLCSSHFVFSDTSGWLVILIAPLYLLLVIFWRSFKRFLMVKVYGPASQPEAAEPEQTEDEKALESLAKQGWAYTTTTGIALLAVGAYGDKIDHTPTLIWLASYNVGAFWMFQGAVFLERGRLFHIWVLLGLIMSLAMFLTGIGFVFVPTYEPLILFISAAIVILHLEWDWIERNVIDWYLEIPHDTTNTASPNEAPGHA